jgi:peptidyl-prolyl cis-trans isomerase SurA
MVDSLPLSETQVEASLNERINNTIAQLGSIEKMEEMYQKSYSVIKEDLRKSIREMMLAQSMQTKVLGDIKITPTEIENFYNSIPKDSIPMIQAQVEVAQLALYPAYAEKSVLETIDHGLICQKFLL